MSRTRVILDTDPPGGHAHIWRCPLVFVPVTRKDVYPSSGVGPRVWKDTMVASCVSNTMAAARVCIQDLVTDGRWPKNSLTATAAYDCTLRARRP